MNYRFTTIKAQTYQEKVTRRGQVTYLNEIELAFKTPGYLMDLNAEVGDKVKTSEVLASLENSELVYQAQALTYRLEFTEKEQKRINKLHTDGLVPKSTLDSINAQFLELNERLKEITYLLLKSDLQTEVDGVVSERYADIGELIQAGQPVLSIVPSKNNVVATFFLTEQEVALIRKDQSADLRIIQSGKKLTGKLHRKAIKADMNGLYRIDLLIDKPLVAGTDVALSLFMKSSMVFAISHHAPVAMSNNIATVLEKKQNEIVSQKLPIVNMDDKYIYVSANSKVIELVSNGWINR